MDEAKGSEVAVTAVVRTRARATLSNVLGQPCWTRGNTVFAWPRPQLARELSACRRAAHLACGRTCPRRDCSGGAMDELARRQRRILYIHTTAQTTAERPTSTRVRSDPSSTPWPITNAPGHSADAHVTWGCDQVQGTSQGQPNPRSCYFIWRPCCVESWIGVCQPPSARPPTVLAI
jgi:hypothetical protein